MLHILAIFAFSLGMAGATLAMTPARGLAVPLGAAAIFFGALTSRAIRRRREAGKGRGLAIAGAALGGIGAVATIVTFTMMISRQVDFGRQQQANRERVQNVIARRPVSKEPVEAFSSNLPIIVLRTDGGYISKEEKTLARAQIFDRGTNGRASILAKPDHEGLATINLRGSSTMHLPKHSYTLHTLDGQTNQTKVSLLGLPAEEDWVLYAPFEDKTMLRDALAMRLAEQMGHYAPRTRFVELFIHNPRRELSMGDYAGVYVLMEKIKRGRDRVNIAKLTPEDNAEPEVSGGYIFKRDHQDRAEQRFHTQHGGPYFYVTPNQEHITQEQKEWLRNYMNQFESALYGGDFADPKKGYAAYLDVDAFIDAHWLNELGKNVDAFRYSAFLTKDRGGKLKTEPPWDWNRSFGNANYYGGGQTHGWYWHNLRQSEISWYGRLREDPEFVRKRTARWRELRQTVFDPKKINAMIDELAGQLTEAQERNFRRWPILGQQLGCNYYVGNSYQEEVRWLKSWVEGRVAWIDSQVTPKRGSGNEGE